MTPTNLRPIIYLLLGVFLLSSSSCVSYYSLRNYNDAPGIPNNPQPILNFKPIKIQPNDVLRVELSGIDQIALQPFSFGGAAGEEGGGNRHDLLVGQDGYIQFPTLGPILVEGLEVIDIKRRIEDGVRPYFKQTPIVNVRLLNFSVHVNGEIRQPGRLTVFNDRLSIIEAVTLAGDFTDYSQRDSVLIIREEKGIRSFGYVNFHSPDIFSSPYFYLQQNDVVYIRPDKSKINAIRDPASRFLPWVTSIVSVGALIISISR